MVWMATTADRRASPGALWPDVRSVIVLGLNYGPDHDPLAILAKRERAAISVYAKGDDYHELIKSRLKSVARWLVAQCRRRGESVRRYRSGDGEAAGGTRRARLAGQAHQSGVAPVRLLAVSWLDLHHARSAGRPSPSRTTAAAAAPVSTFVRPRRFPHLTGWMRGAAFRISPSSTRDRSRASYVRSWAIASMAATIVSPSVRGTNSRCKAARRNSPRATRCARRRSRELAAPRRCAIPRAVLQDLDQAHRPRSFRTQCADRHRQFGRCRRSRAKPSACSTMLRRWCAAPRSGRCRG